MHSMHTLGSMCKFLLVCRSVGGLFFLGGGDSGSCHKRHLHLSTVRLKSIYKPAIIEVCSVSFGWRSHPPSYKTNWCLACALDCHCTRILVPLCGAVSAVNHGGLKEAFSWALSRSAAPDRARHERRRSRVRACLENQGPAFVYREGKIKTLLG